MLLPTLLAISLAQPAADCRARHAQGDHPNAVARCIQALPAASLPARSELYRLLGESFLSLGEAAQARSAFVSLLAIVPAAPPSAGAGQVFEEAQRLMREVQVRVVAAAKEPVRAGEPIAL